MGEPTPRLLVDVTDELIELMASGAPPPVHLDFDELLTPMAAEIKRFRAARAADKDRVRTVLKETIEYVAHRAIDAALGEVARQVGSLGHTTVEARGAGMLGVATDAIADRVANALATPAPTLTQERVRAVVIEACRAENMGVFLASPRASAIADRVAEQLAGSAPEDRRSAREAKLSAIGFEEPSEAQRRENLTGRGIAPPPTEVAPAVVLSDWELDDLESLSSDLNDSRRDCIAKGRFDEGDTLRDRANALDRLIAAHRKAP